MRNYTCIACPLGCQLSLDDSDSADLKVSGNKCPRGHDYAIEEFTSPKRVVTATIAADSKRHPRIPVKTNKPLPKQLVEELLSTIYGMTLKLPVKTGDVIIDDFKGTGVRVVAARTCE